MTNLATIYSIIRSLRTVLPSSAVVQQELDY